MTRNVREMDSQELNSPVFEERLVFLRESQSWPREKLEAFQVKQLQRLVRRVQEKVPFYRDFLNAEGLSWEDFTSIEDIQKFPTITKEIIQDNYDDFVSDEVNEEELLHISTGGSTGDPLTIYMDRDTVARDKANTEYYMNVIGLDIFNYRSVRLYGNKVPEQRLKNGEYWYLDGDRKLVMSCYHINKETADAYVSRINGHDPKYIHARPSAILQLSKYIRSQGIELEKPIEYIVTDGEHITKGQREIIESVFDGRIYNVYGHTEGCVFACQCQHSRLLHFVPQVGLLELVDEDGEWVTEEGARGEMVTTGFNNLHFPLIRYRTEDMAVNTNRTCECGRNYTMVETVEGRMQDYVIDNQDSLTPLAPAVFNYDDMNWKGIRTFRVFQNEKGKLLIKIVTEDNNTEPADDMKERIRNKLSTIFGDTFSIEIKFTDHLRRTDIGKFRYLEQNLDTSEYF